MFSRKTETTVLQTPIIHGFSQPCEHITNSSEPMTETTFAWTRRISTRCITITSQLTFFFLEKKSFTKFISIFFLATSFQHTCKQMHMYHICKENFNLQTMEPHHQGLNALICCIFHQGLFFRKFDEIALVFSCFEREDVSRYATTIFHFSI